MSKLYGWLIAAAGGIGLLLTAYFKGKSVEKGKAAKHTAKAYKTAAEAKREVDEKFSHLSDDERERLYEQYYRD